MFSVRSRLRWREEQWRRQAPDVIKVGGPPMLQRQHAHCGFFVVDSEEVPVQVLAEVVFMPLSPPLSPPREYAGDNFDPPDAPLFQC